MRLEVRPQEGGGLRSSRRAGEEICVTGAPLMDDGTEGKGGGRTFEASVEHQIIREVGNACLWIRFVCVCGDAVEP